MNQPRLPLPLRAMRRAMSPAIFNKMLLAEIDRRRRVKALNDRSGVCVCGVEVRLHFDERNRKIACEDIR